MIEKIKYLRSRGLNYPVGWFKEDVSRLNAMYFKELAKETQEMRREQESSIERRMRIISEEYSKRYDSSFEVDCRENRSLAISRVTHITEELRKRNEC